MSKSIPIHVQMDTVAWDTDILLTMYFSGYDSFNADQDPVL